MIESFLFLLVWAAIVFLALRTSEARDLATKASADAHAIGADRMRAWRIHADAHVKLNSMIEKVAICPHAKEIERMRKELHDLKKGMPNGR